MRNIFLTSNLAEGAAGGFVTLRHELALWWHRMPVALHSPVWPRMLATLVILGLLLAFHQVVRGAVQQGELRRKVSAVQAEASWRCDTLRGLRARDRCILQLDAAAYGESVLQAQNLTTGATLE